MFLSVQRMLCALLFLGAISAAHAQIYDAAADYSTTNNPNGVWSAGYTNTLGSQFNLYDTNISFGGGTIWYSPAISALASPSFGKNLTQFGALAKQDSLHPGPANQYSVLRFIAPSANTYTLDTQFFIGDSGDTDAYVLLNANTSAPLLYAPTTNANPALNTSLFLNVGDRVDFVVGSKGNFNFDTTPLSARFSVVPAFAVPEPGTVALLLAGGVAGTGWLLRRRGMKRVV